MAWRNSNRCIGRFFWDSLTVVDARHIQSENDFINAIENHIATATNNGKIKPYITIFSKDDPPQIFNKHIPQKKVLLNLLNILAGRVHILTLIFYL